MKPDFNVYHNLSGLNHDVINKRRNIGRILPESQPKADVENIKNLNDSTDIKKNEVKETKEISNINDGDKNPENGIINNKVVIDENKDKKIEVKAEQAHIIDKSVPKNQNNANKDAKIEVDGVKAPKVEKEVKKNVEKVNEKTEVVIDENGKNEVNPEDASISEEDEDESEKENEEELGKKENEEEIKAKKLKELDEKEKIKLDEDQRLADEDAKLQAEISKKENESKLDQIELPDEESDKSKLLILFGFVLLGMGAIGLTYYLGNSKMSEFDEI